MALRTTAGNVQATLGRNYDPALSASLTRAIATANALVDRVATCATAKGTALTAVELELIEGYMAAYYYCKTDPTYKNRSTLGASGGFNTDPDDFKNQAIELDPSGCLKAALAGNRAGGGWLGKPDRDKLDYSTRND